MRNGVLTINNAVRSLPYFTWSLGLCRACWQYLLRSPSIFCCCLFRVPTLTNSLQLWTRTPIVKSQMFRSFVCIVLVGQLYVIGMLFYPIKEQTNRAFLQHCILLVLDRCISSAPVSWCVLFAIMLARFRDFSQTSSQHLIADEQLTNFQLPF